MMAANEIVINLIVAACDNFGIGFKGNLPWILKKEMAYFSRLTKTTDDPDKQNAVLMGRKTWMSIPEKNRPLPGRINIVLSRDASSTFPGAHLCRSIEDALKLLTNENMQQKVEKLWVIGGSSVYEAMMNSPLCYRIYLTRVHGNFECDTFIPEINAEKFKLVTDSTIPQNVQEENDIKYTYEVYEKK